MGFIYRLLFPNGKGYVGQTGKDDPNKRWNQHRQRRSHCWLVARAIKKYGWENVKKEALLEIPNDLLNNYEVKFIDWLDTLTPNGYNITPGGDFNPMSSDEVRNRLIEKLQTDEHREAQRVYTLEWHRDVEKHEAWRTANEASARNPTKRQKHRESATNTWKDPTMRKNRTDGLARAFSDPIVSQRRKDAAAAGVKKESARANMTQGHALNRERKLAKLPPGIREKKQKDMERRRVKARNKYRKKHGLSTDRIVGQ